MQTAAVAPPPARRAAPWVPAAAALGGFAWFLKSVGAHTLDPTEMGWLGDGDFAAHALGWLFFRNEPWTLPLGWIGGLNHPLGTTVGFTDANPWVSVLLKPLSPWLPADFQFIGLWLALCFALQGFFGARIVEAFTPHPAHRMLGGVLFALAPGLLHRIGHDTLCAQWLLLALIWLHVRRDAPPRRTIAWAFVFSLLAAGIHPYLGVMLVPLTLSLLLRLYLGSRIAGRTAAALSAAVVAQTLALFALFGYIGTGAKLAEGGFGIYAADALTFFNAMGYSRVLPQLPPREGQYEGFAFLGTGVLALGIVAAALALRGRLRPGVPRRYWPLGLAAALMGGFAMSNIVTVAGYVVLTMRSVYTPLHPLVEPFRASGRFIWPLYYVVFAGILALIVRRGVLRTGTVTALLAGAVAVQAADVTGVWPGTRISPAQWPRVQSPAWDAISPPYRHLVIYPPYHMVSPAACEPGPLAYPDVVRLSDVAYRKRLTINSAYVARTSMDVLEDYCADLRAAVLGGRFEPDTIYVVRPEAWRVFERADRQGLTCGTLDGFRVCVTGRETAFAARVAEHQRDVR